MLPARWYCGLSGLEWLGRCGNKFVVNFFRIKKLALFVLMSTLFSANLFAADSVPWAELEKLLAEIRANKVTREAAIAKGKELAAFCTLCHGLDGNSTKPDVPHLAAQDTAYLLQQIERFADGRRNDYIMSPLAKRLTSGEKIALVLYYNSQTRRNDYRRPEDPAMVIRGREMYKKKCAGCHGTDGRGKPGYSYVAGQSAKYLSSTLTHFRENTGGRNNAVMAAITSKLSNDDIDALSVFISSLH